MDKSLSSQRWLARLSFTLAGLAIVVLAVFGGLKSLAMLAVAVARRRREPGCRLYLPGPAGGFGAGWRSPFSSWCRSP
jgi:hypothetical protein